MLPDIPTAVYRRLNGKPEQQNERRRSLILDIGANAGAFTSRILQSPACRGGGHQTSKCHVLAFECVPEYARYIRESHDRRDPFVPRPDSEMKDDLTVVNACASEKRGKGVIYTSSDGNLGWNTQVAEQTLGHKMTKVEVEEVRAEDVVEGLGFFARRGLGLPQDLENPEKPRKTRDFDLSLMKIDTEGAEYRVLRGMRGLLRRLKGNEKTKMPILMVEFGWGAQRHPHAAEELEMFDWLVQELGYTPDKNYREIKKTEDIVFLPAD
eukprot:g4544.t1